MSREKRLDKAKLRVLFNLPFFAPGVARLPVVFADNINGYIPVPTACTNGERIIWNPEWFDGLKDDEIVTVYCEEVGHCMLGHIWRHPIGADHVTWNRACDAAVRGMMDEFGELLTKKGLANPFPFPDKQLLEDWKPYSGMCEEKIYSIIRQNQPPKSKKPKGGMSGQGKGGSGSAQGQPGGNPSPPGKQFAEFVPAGGGQQNKAANDKAHNGWKNVLIQAACIAKGRGTIPLGISRMIDDMVNPEVPWQELLRMHVRELVNDDWNWMKPDIAMSDSTGFVMPSLDSERMGGVVFAIDTSGSIDHELLKAFKSEAQYCLDEMRPSKLMEICCDSKIHQVKEYRCGDKIEGNAPGGGGTAFEPVFDHLENEVQTPKCVVYLTDLDGSFPKEEPPYPIIWVVYGTEKVAPFGQTVRVR